MRSLILFSIYSFRNRITSSASDDLSLVMASTTSDPCSGGQDTKAFHVSSAAKHRPIANIVPGIAPLQDWTTSTVLWQTAADQANKFSWAYSEPSVQVEQPCLQKCQFLHITWYSATSCELLWLSTALVENIILPRTLQGGSTQTASSLLPFHRRVPATRWFLMWRRKLKAPKSGRPSSQTYR